MRACTIGKIFILLCTIKANKRRFSSGRVSNRPAQMTNLNACFRTGYPRRRRASPELPHRLPRRNNYRRWHVLRCSHICRLCFHAQRCTDDHGQASSRLLEPVAVREGVCWIERYHGRQQPGMWYGGLQRNRWLGSRYVVSFLLVSFHLATSLLSPFLPTKFNAEFW